MSGGRFPLPELLRLIGEPGIRQPSKAELMPVTVQMQQGKFYYGFPKDSFLESVGDSKPLPRKGLAKNFQS
jgi:hypothetical protein